MPLSKGEIYEEIKKLKELFDIGALTEEEFEEEKRELRALLKQIRKGDTGAGVSPNSSMGVGKKTQGVLDDFVTGYGGPIDVSSPAEVGKQTQNFLNEAPTSPPPPPKKTGEIVVGMTLLGRYKILDLLGEGGMGKVFLCKDLKLGELYALKVIKADFAKEPSFQERFVNELRITRRLNHNGIVRTYEFLEDPTTSALYFTMEYIQGNSLEEYLLEKKKQKKLPLMELAELAKLLKAIAEPLSYAHEQGVIHRDLKPSNIILLSEGDIKLMDFGISKALSETHATKHTGHIGTIGYMPPEQMRGGTILSVQSDIYSVGTISYEILTGENPMLVRFVPPSCFVKNLPQRLDEVVMKAIAQRPEDRFDSAKTFAQAFQDALNHPPQPIIEIKEPQNPQPSKKEPEKRIIRDIRGVRFEELLIPAGEFMMGSPVSEKGRYGNEKQHKVILTHPFYMARTPITQAQFEKMMGYNPSRFKGKKRPVERVNWHEAAAFCNVLSRKMGLPECYELTGSEKDVEATIKPKYEGQKYYECKGYRLPTEAEWEYAYRAGTTTAFYNGDITSEYGVDPNLDNIGWYWENSKEETHPVAQKKPNAWGLYDMAGNVWEWVHDWYQMYNSDLDSAPEVDPVNSRSGSYRVNRGGSWYNSASFCRAANRHDGFPSDHDYNLGFRFARSL